MNMEYKKTRDSRKDVAETARYNDVRLNETRVVYVCEKSSQQGRSTVEPHKVH